MTEKNINTLCSKLRKTELLERITNVDECMYGNTFVETVYDGQLNEIWRVGNKTGHERITSRILFKF